MPTDILSPVKVKRILNHFHVLTPWVRHSLSCSSPPPHTPHYCACVTLLRNYVFSTFKHVYDIIQYFWHVRWFCNIFYKFSQLWFFQTTFPHVSKSINSIIKTFRLNNITIQTNLDTFFFQHALLLHEPRNRKKS